MLICDVFPMTAVVPTPTKGKVIQVKYEKVCPVDLLPFMGTFWDRYCSEWCDGKASMQSDNWRNE